MVAKSAYVLFVDNLSSITRRSDLRYELEGAGPIVAVERLDHSRCALVEFKRASDAKYAWGKYDGIKLDGRRLKIDWATKSDFKDFSWEWTESSPSPSPRRHRSMSRSVSVSKSSRSPSR